MNSSAIPSSGSVEHEIRRWIFPAYLAFSVIFYATRYIFQWGPETTVYANDAPESVKAIKDFVWIAFLTAILVWRLDAVEATLAHIRKNWKFFTVLGAFVAWFAVTGLVHAMIGDSEMDVFLRWYRYPLEYIPIAALVPSLIADRRTLGKTTLWLGVLAVAFLMMEMFSSRDTGFMVEQDFVRRARYGSIFGSPNDFGVFCSFMLIGVALWARSKWHWLLAGGLGLGLVLSFSRSAWVGFLAGVFSLWSFKRIRRLLLAAIVGASALMVIALITLNESLLGQLDFLSQRVAVEDWAVLQRMSQVDLFWQRFSSLEDVGTLLFGTRYFHLEDQYMVLMVRTGVVGLLLFLVVATMTLRRGWILRRVSPVHAAGFSAVVVVLVASIFIPYLDVFPTNLYFWIAVGLVWAPAGQLEHGLDEYT